MVKRSGNTSCGFVLCVVLFFNIISIGTCGVPQRELVEIDEYEGTARTISSCYIMIRGKSILELFLHPVVFSCGRVDPLNKAKG